MVDVITAELCVCEDASGRLLEDVPTSRLETVVPRKQPGVVMVVRGPHAGQVNHTDTGTATNTSRLETVGTARGGDDGPGPAHRTGKPH